MGGSGQSGGSTDWGSNLSQGGYTQQPTFDWQLAARGLQQGAATYANAAQPPNFITGAPQGTQMAPMPTTTGLDVNDQGLVIGTDKRIYDYQELQALQDALRRIDAQTLALPPRDFRPNPRREYALPTASGLYGTDEELGISF